MNVRIQRFAPMLLFAVVLAPVARGGDLAVEEVFAVGTSAGARIDTRTDETHWIAGGTVEALYGEAAWTAPSKAGVHVLTHEGDGGTWTARYEVAGTGVEVVGDLDVEGDATWGADKTWLVTGTVVVKPEATLTMEAGASVLQGPSGSLLANGGTVAMEGATVAQLDAAAVRTQGEGAGVRIDTRTDEKHWVMAGTVEALYGEAAWTAPSKAGVYALMHDGDGGKWTARYEVVGEGVEVVGDWDVECDTAWGADKTWLLTGTVVAKEGATLAVGEGTSILQTPGGSILANGGTVVLNGASVASMDALAVRTQAGGAGVRIDTRTDETHWIMAGTVEELYGEAAWTAPSKAGIYQLAHDGDGATWTARYEVAGDGIQVVGDLDVGVDTIWGADKPWLLTGTVVVNPGATLTVESGANILQTLGGSLLANGGTVALNGAAVAQLDASAVKTQGAGAGVRVDTRTDEAHWIMAGTVEELYGEAAWTAPAKAGMYTLTHEGDGATWSARYEVAGDGVEVVGDWDVDADVAWGADKTWLVTGTVVVNLGVTLTVEGGASILQSLGGSILANGGAVALNGAMVAQLDASAVKTQGAGTGVRVDTRTDETHWIMPGTVEELYGEAPWTAPAKAGVYALTHEGDGAAWTARYEVPDAGCEVVGDLDVAGDTTWGADKTWLVSGTVVVRPGAVLTVESGADVVFDVTGSLIRDGGSVASDGAHFSNRVFNGNLSYAGGGAEGVVLDTTAGEVQVAEGVQQITYGTEWGETPAASVAVYCTGPDEVQRTLVSAAGPAEGAVEWAPDGAGGYDLRHVAGEETLTARFVVPDLETTVVVKGGSIVGNVEWGAEKTILVVGPVTVEKGATLTIERGTVVKFMDGAGLDCASGGSCVAEGVVFTHVNDDTAGGDTMFDGESEPVVGGYSIGNIQIDEATQLRYYPTMVETLSGTISANETWRGWNVYRVTGNLTIASGATLNINPGAIVKFDAGVSLTVNSGGTLNAVGTRAQPIVFTSVKDDEHGGDTNGDGDGSVPAAGDWKKIAVYGTANFEYAKVRYASSGTSTDDAILVSGGSVTFNNSELAFGQMYAVGVESGHFYATNSVIREFYCAFRHWPYDPFVNGVIYNCNRLSNNNGQKLYNTVVVGVTEAWDWSSGSGNTYGHCLFWNDPGTGLQGLPGSASAANGNIWGNPLFLDAENGDFRVEEGSPCVDAGDTAMAPETDYYGQPRASAFGEAVADIGIYEVQPRGVAGDVDLVTVSISADAEASPGGELRVSWEVGNRGGKMASGARRDAVALVSAGGREVALGEKVFTQNVAAGGTAKCEAVFRVPPMAEGTWWPKVVVNSQQDIFEGSLIANNARTGETGVEVSVPATAASTGASGTVVAGVPTVLKLHFETGDGNRMVVLNVPQGVSVAWGFGFVPQGALQSGETTVEDGVPVQFLVPDAEDEMDVYVVLESDTTEIYELSTESTKLTITGVTPDTLPLSGTTTLTITGAGFTPTSQVAFVAGGRMVEPESIQADAGGLSAVVDCAKLLAGTLYDVTVADAGQESTLKNAFSVMQEEGQPKIVWHLETPESIRQGREYSGRIDFRNEGTSDAPMPIFILSGDAGTSLRLLEKEAGDGSRVLWLLGVSDDSFGALKPSEERSIHFCFKTTSSGNGRISCRILDETAGIDGSDAEAVLKSRFAGAETALAALLTGTWGDFAGRIRSFVSTTHRFAAQETDVLSVVGSYLEWQENNGVVVRGRCLEWDGKAARGSVRLYLSNDDDEELAQRTETDDDGRYWFAGVASGRYTVRFGDDDAVRTLDVDAGGTYDVDLAVEGSQMVLRGRVVDTDGNPIVGGKVSCWTSHGLANVQTDGNGEFEISVRELGNCTCVVEAEGYLSVVVKNVADLAPEEPIVMTNGVYVHRTAMQDGEAVSNAVLVVCSTDSEGVKVVATDAGGMFAVTLAPGEYELQTTGGEILDAFVVASGTETVTTQGMRGGRRDTTHGELYLETQEAMAFDLAVAMGAWGGLSGQPQSGEFLMHAILPLGENSQKPSRLIVDSGTIMSRFAKKYDTYKTMKAAIGEEIEAAFAEASPGRVTSGSHPDNLVFAYGIDGNPDWKLLTPLGLAFGGTRRPTLWTARLQSVEERTVGSEIIQTCHVRLFVSAPDIYDFHFPFIADFVALQDAKWMWPFDSLLEIEDEYVFTRKKPAEMPREPGTNGQENRFAVPQSVDPNEMSGPLGAGERRLVAPGEWMTYTVYFENKSDATAAAQEVYVEEALSGALDWSTFEMVDVGFNNQLDLGLGGKRKGASETAMTETAYKVRTELDYSAKTGVANWYMRIVDEATETRWPRDVYAGFLPPNDATGRGEGHITYRVKLRDDAAAGTVVRASANIVFDYNAAIETDPAWWNTVAEMGTATVDLGNGVSTNVTVMVGAPWIGQLPDPGKRPGMRFAGWFTGPNGTGLAVTEESVAAAGAKLYAFWDATAAPELWLDVSWGAVEIGTNGVVKGYAPDGSSVEGSANRYVLTGTSQVNGVKFAGGSFTNTWTNLVINLNAKDAVAVTLEGASLEVTLAGDNSVASGEDCAGVRVDAASALVLQGEGRLAAQGGKCGAGIGGGKLQESGRIEVRSGTVEARGGEYGAGIGGGLVASAAREVVIAGGSVKARGSDGGEDIGGGFGREGTGAPVDAEGAAVHEVEVPLATDTLPAEVVVDLGGWKTYRYAGPGHEGDTSLWFWLPDGTYEFVADGDDYGAHVAGEGTSAVFTDPGNANFVPPPVGGVWNEDGTVRAGLNPAYRTSPFELWTATGLAGKGWNWTRLPASAYVWDPTNAVLRIPDDTNRMRMLRLRFLER